MKYKSLPYKFEIRNRSMAYKDGELILEKGPHEKFYNRMLTNTDDSNLRCVVVGGSPNILNYEYGGKIDLFDKVIRVNSSPTKDYEHHVGKVTNIWATSLNPGKTFDPKRWDNFYFPDELRDNEVWFRTIATYEQYSPYINRWFGNGINYRVLTTKMMKSPPKFTKKSSTPIGNGTIYTTGIQAILGALQLYKKVSILGFTFYTETKSDNNTTYPGITLSENLKKHAKGNASILQPFVEDERLIFLHEEEEKNFKSILGIE